MRAAPIVVVVVSACGAPRTVPPPVPPAPSEPAKPAAPAKPTDVVDEGAFEMYVAADLMVKEVFSIRRTGTGHLVLRARSVDAAAPPKEGELEVDTQYRPVRGLHWEGTGTDRVEHKLGGSPLTLEITRGSVPWKTEVASAPVDIYLDGPGMVALTAACRIEGEATLRVLGTDAGGQLQAFVGPPFEKLKRVVLNVADENFEVLCDGDKLLMGRLRKFGIAFTREGMRPELDAFVASAELPAHAWPKLPQDPNEPYDAGDAWLVDGKTFVVVDRRRRMLRLTALDAASGKQLAQRELDIKRGEPFECAGMPKAQLACSRGGGASLQLDARTLADAPAAHAADAKPAKPAKPDAKADAKPAAKIDPTNCMEGAEEGVKVGAELWRIDPLEGGSKLLRTKGKQALTPVVLAFSSPRLLGCKPKGGGAFLIDQRDPMTTLVHIAADTKLRWQRDIFPAATDIFLAGTALVIGTRDHMPRVVSVEAKAGAIKWVWPPGSSVMPSTTPSPATGAGGAPASQP